ncbi:MAG: ribonuclease P protein component [Prevotella sp.]|jgi:ribonuclease P protein component|nr:ribonuclease P protein component [Prevotella sp.]
MENKDTYRNTFPKEEKLCRTKSIDRLFAAGNSFIAYPLRVVYCLEDKANDRPSISVLTNVSKKKFKRAVKRNRVKRLIREAYRLNKAEYIGLLESDDKCMDIAFLYLKNELPTYQEIEKSIKKASAILSDKLKEEEQE